MEDVLLSNMSLGGWQDGSVGRGACWESMVPERGSWNPQKGDRRQLTPQSRPLTTTLTPWHEYPPPYAPHVSAHTITLKKLKNLDCCLDLFYVIGKIVSRAK